MHAVVVTEENLRPHLEQLEEGLRDFNRWALDSCTVMALSFLKPPRSSSVVFG